MKFAAVIVTFNRLNLLKKVLEAFDRQTRLPDYIFVVNNASTDGTDDYLEKWKNIDIGNKKVVITSDANVGGSGGFYLGTESAINTDADWIWVSDDDALPEIDVFEKAEKHIEELNENVAAICTQVQTDGETDITHRKNIYQSFIRMYQKPVNKDNYNRAFFECNSCSYVGMIMKASILKKVGLINKDFFIWQDDLEHSIRINQEGKIICFPDMIVDHRITKSDYIGINWKTYYGYRNDLNILKAYFPKRYFFFKTLRMYQKSLVPLDKEHFKIVKAAIKGSKNNEKGLNKIYQPGWKKIEG